MATYKTREVLEELKGVLDSNADLTFVDYSPVTPLAQEENSVAAYISLEQEVQSIARQRTDISGTNRTLLIPVTINVDCGVDKLLIYDIINSIETSILDDSQLWDKITDRDIITIEYDNAEAFPKRTAVMLLEIKYRLTC